MRLIGYWRGDDETEDPRLPDRLPDPRLLADPSWLPEERHLLIRYLRADYAVRCFWGYSWCRFDCGIPHEAMGSKEYSDGVWVWPHGLPHYVEHHDVMLPDEFISHCRANNWICPTVRSADLSDPDQPFDLEFWIEWANRTIKKRHPDRAP